MVNSLPSDDQVLNFLKDKMTIDYEILASVKDGKLIPLKEHDWLKLNLINLPSLYGGTYIFKQEADNSCYIGSTISHALRAIDHRDHFGGDSPSPFYLRVINSQNTLKYSIIHLVPNYYKIFKEKYPLTKITAGHKDILLAFSRFPCRVLEQMLIDELKPSLNKLEVVIHEYAGWSPSRLLVYEEALYGSKPINITDTEGNILYQSSSWGKDRDLVGMRSSSIKDYVDNSKSFYSPYWRESGKKYIYFRNSKTLSSDIVTRPLTGKLVNTLEFSLFNRILIYLSRQFLYAFKSDKK